MLVCSFRSELVGRIMAKFSIVIQEILDRNFSRMRLGWQRLNRCFLLN